MTVKILAFSGSLRKDSYNKKLAKIVAAGAEKAGAEVTYIDLKDYPLPLFNEDDEAANGIHENALKLKALMNEADGFIITSPEYNGSYSGALKNIVDWASRQADGEGMLQSFKGKYAAIFSTSPGAFGGLRGLAPLRLLLSGIGTTILSDQVAIPKAGDAFNEDGTLVSEKRLATLERIAGQLVDTCQKMKG
ncbi:NADPH-dependent FMN reductase [Pleionea sp. CnH1-48]|uniref:NADPH-dependent FMN reductase n=1 Tax=Pleionea sp. CnH1-48 TaxID=2954494 RepID=UPI0020970D71|nr:NAD(P)H-dependent oxidoreductase [Pleionea sp. CnH1-48]MCO7224212.1 NAD(P)H-dependent oxidoreductase [Pleionea sp. CnH1-48]